MRAARPPDRTSSTVGTAALVSDRGLRHHRNEDAAALAAGDGWVVAVVCDGVSTTANPDLAARAAAGACAEAVRAAMTEMTAPFDPARLGSALDGAAAAAHAAVAAVVGVERGGYREAPSATLVAAIMTSGHAVVVNVGDSRAYLLAGCDARRLSVDDSWAQAAIAEGTDADVAYADSRAHEITAWLGSDLGTLSPHLCVAAHDALGHVLLCSDGLWNYFPEDEAMAALFEAGGPGEEPLARAGRLVDAAMSAGGADNITVVVVPLAGLGTVPPDTQHRPTPSKDPNRD
jgi:serine/threonine protein phosphatase PrpC